MTEIQYILLGFAFIAASFIYVHYLIDRVKKSLKTVKDDLTIATMIITMLATEAKDSFGQKDSKNVEDKNK
jgi:hypothetical protein